MSLGLGIFLLVLGGILGFAVEPDAVGVVNLNVVGYVCLAAGLLAVVLSLVVSNQRQHRTDRVEHVDERRPRDYPPGR